jgi:hypothetical protein
VIDNTLKDRLCSLQEACTPSFQLDLQKPFDFLEIVWVAGVRWLIILSRPVLPPMDYDLNLKPKSGREKERKSLAIRAVECLSFSLPSSF